MGRAIKYSVEFQHEVSWFVREHGRQGRALARERWGFTAGELGGLLYRVKSSQKSARLFDIRIAPAKPVTVTGDVMIVGDVHVPTTDYELCQRMTIIALNYLKAPRQLIIAGDLFNLDFLSIYPPVSKTPEWKREKLAARALIQEWLTVFDRILFIAGNHDRRITKATAAHMTIEDLMDIVIQDERVVTSEWGWCMLNSGSRSFRVTHGRNYSVNTGTVGNELAHKHATNIISHHQHHASISLDRFKRYIVVDNAALVDQKKLAYVSLDENKAPNMARGFCVVRNGEPQLFVDGITVWENWLPQAAARNGRTRKAA